MGIQLVPFEERNAIAQEWYTEFKQIYHLTEMPILYVNWISMPDDPVECPHVVDDDTIVLLAELRMREVYWYLYKLDLKAVLFHEYTHIWDMVEIRRRRQKEDMVDSCLSELHAIFVETDWRIRLSQNHNATLDTLIPIRSDYRSIHSHLISMRDDICDSITEAQRTHDEEIITHIWKQTQYLAAKICYLSSQYNMCIPDIITSQIPKDILDPFTDTANLLLENIDFIYSPNERIRKNIYSAYSFLESLES